MQQATEGHVSRLIASLLFFWGGVVR